MNDKARTVIAGITAVSFAGFMVFLVFWIIIKGSDVSHTRDADQSVIAASERLTQMAQWTIATILTLGGALIGLNWYQNEKRYQEDKKAIEKRFDDQINELKTKVGFLEFVSNSQLLLTVYKAVSDKIGNPEEPDFVARAINEYRTNESSTMRNAIATILEQYVSTASANNRTHWSHTGLADIQAFNTELRREFPKIANLIAVILAMIEKSEDGRIDQRG